MSTSIRAAVLVTGDEVLGGRVVERNAAFIARELAGCGVALERTVIVGDRIDRVRRAIEELLTSGVDLVCVTGGLGPTYDDLTMQAVAEATGRRLRVFTDALALVEMRSRGVRRQMQVTDAQLDAMRRKQATLPEGATMLPPIGTAPGCTLRHEDALIVVLPGPPHEAQDMWHAARLRGDLAHLLAGTRGPAATTLHLWGVTEAELMTALHRLAESDLAQVGTYTRDGELEIVVPHAIAESVTHLLNGAFPGAIFAQHGQSVDSLVAAALQERGERLAVAESCTGGGLGARLTALPGASQWFDGGVIAYDNAVKITLLGVPPHVIEHDGAVSEQCAIAMADGARRVTGADWAVAVTGVAGPDGGSATKPVGTVWIAVTGAQTITQGTRFWSRGRESVRLRAQTAALHLVRRALEG